MPKNNEKIEAKRHKYRRKIDKLKARIEGVRAKVRALQAECGHDAKYSTNCMGRDPGGAHCPTCGKSW